MNLTRNVLNGCFFKDILVKSNFRCPSGNRDRPIDVTLLYINELTDKATFTTLSQDTSQMTASSSGR